MKKVLNEIYDGHVDLQWVLLFYNYSFLALVMVGLVHRVINVSYIFTSIHVELVK